MLRETEQQGERLVTEVPASPVPIELVPGQASSTESSQPILGMEDFNPEDRDPRPLHRPSLRRVLLVLAILAGLAALLFVPPLVSMNHYRRQIASSISASLGRPVRIDSVTLNLLPIPGFTLQNFIVGEDPAFGSEPVIRANSVIVMLRVSSLWGRRVEFSRIRLDSPSVNLVRLPDGRWNLESILLQASHVQAAPTAQRQAGATPRFPYIEATGARLNIKSGLEKLPISLTDASFALWLPQPNQWQLRIEAHPARTDTAATDTGTLRVEGSLGRSHRLQDVPINLSASWSGAPLGAASWILLGRDDGLRGDLSVQASAVGTAGDNTLSSRLQMTGLRRADFVPERTLALDLRCGAHALTLFHELEQVHCVWPFANGSDGLDVSGKLPNVTDPRSAEAHAVFNKVPVNALLDALKAASPRVARDLNATGAVSGDLRYGPPAPAILPVVAASQHRGRTVQPQLLQQVAGPSLWGTIVFRDVGLTPGNGAAFLIPEAVSGTESTATKPTSTDTSRKPTGTITSTDTIATATGDQITVAPFPVILDGQTPALLSAHFDRSGYRLHLSGPVLRSRLAQLAHNVPQFGDGLPESLLSPISPANPGAARAPESALRVDLDSARTWRGGQTWSPAVPARPGPHHRPGRAGRLRSAPANPQ